MNTEVRRLIGVYDADGTLRGELSYWINARFGKAHCALCDITHGLARTKAEWKLNRATLPVPFDTYHRDDQPEAVRAATGDTAAVVVAETADGIVLLVGPSELEGCHGSPDALVLAIDAALARHGLVYPDS
jgi:hypothetical protein